MKQKCKLKYFRYGNMDYPYELYIGGVKRMNLRVRADGSIRLSVPRLTPQCRIDAFLARYGEKIAQAVRRNRDLPTVPVEESLPTEQAAKQERLLAIIHECHRDLILPRFLALSLTEEQRRFITSPTAIRIRPMKTRWGSCNFKKGTLNFNLYLLDQPRECIEYVVMHEFAHFLQPDHSPAYHALMTALMLDWKERKKRLNY